MTMQQRDFPSRSSPNEYSTIFGKTEERAVESAPTWRNKDYSEFINQNDGVSGDVNQNENNYLAQAINLVHEM